MHICLKAFICGWISLSPLLSNAGIDAKASGDHRLVDAVEQRDTAKVHALLAQHASVNTPQADGATALAWAAHWNDLEIADLLIRAGADMNAANDNGITPLMLACTNRSAPMVENLLIAGANPNASQRTGETPLMTCARTGNEKTVRLLLENGSNVNAKETRKGQTALMWAAAEKHLEEARVLIEHGADVNAQSTNGFTPLMFSAQQGATDIANLLLSAGANIDHVTPEYGSALVVASASGHESTAIFLLEKGADPDATGSNGLTALHYAFQKGIANVSGVQRGPYVMEWFRPDMLALAEALLANGADPNVRLEKIPARLMYLRSVKRRVRLEIAGATPFFLAAAASDADGMRILAQAGANPLLGTYNNTTPLMVAAGLGWFQNEIPEISPQDRTEEEQRASLEAVKVALELGADVNAVGERGMTALHGAAGIGSDAIVQLLVNNGANINHKDECGQTALSIAESDPNGLVYIHERHRSHKSTASLLLQLGAEPLPSTLVPRDISVATKSKLYQSGPSRCAS